jgi:hypothetical protein
MIIITADDFGKNQLTTDSVISCASRKRLTSISAMVFMEDSERAAYLSRTLGDLEVGLHLNFTMPLDPRLASPEIQGNHKRLSSYLTRRPISQVIYNPFLAGTFSVVFRAQQEEFIRLYGKSPDFYNGHHHVHLCSNVLFGRLLPEGAYVRRTFTLERSGKDLLRKVYSFLIGGWVVSHFVTTDAFYSINPVGDCDRLRHIAARGISESVEIEVHPENETEASLLLSDRFDSLFGGTFMGGFRHLRAENPSRRPQRL